MDPHRLARIPGGSRSHSILIVDDDAGVRNLLTDWVEGLGYQAHVAENAEAGLDIARSQHMDVALVDIMLPGRDGAWLISQMQRHCLYTAIIIVTGLTTMDACVTLSPGVTAYIVKPFKFDTVKGRIEEALRSRANLPPAHSIPLNDIFRPAVWGRAATRSPLRLQS